MDKVTITENCYASEIYNSLSVGEGSLLGYAPAVGGE